MSVAVPIALTGTDETVYTVGSNQLVTFRGFTVAETGGTSSATVRIFDNTASSGTLLETVRLAAGESRSEFYDTGKLVNVGIRVDYGGSGTVEGSVFVS